MEELLKYNKDSKLNFIYGFKVITMLFVIGGHRFFYLAGSPLVYAITGEDVSSKMY